MIDLAARNSPHPRPLLSPRIGKSAVPYSVKTITTPYLPIPGYFEPFYIDLSASVSVYLEYGPVGGITGVFEHQEEGRKEISLGKPQKRSVKIYGLRLTGPRHIAFVQVSVGSSGWLHAKKPSLKQMRGLSSQQYLRWVPILS